MIAGSEFHWTAQALAKRISQIKHLGRIRADVRYIPEEEVETFFAAADAVVLPYRGKNYLGNYGPMITACGYERPLIVSDVGEMGWLVRERGLGFAVRPDSVEALLEALQLFIRLPAETREQMQARARKVAQECSFASMARRLADIYTKHSRKTVP